MEFIPFLERKSDHCCFICEKDISVKFKRKIKTPYSNSGNKNMEFLVCKQCAKKYYHN